MQMRRVWEPLRHNASCFSQPPSPNPLLRIGLTISSIPPCRRVDDRAQTWQMPQGGIDPLENPLIAAFRELREETGMTTVQYVAALDPWIDYEFPTKVRHHLTGQWVRYRGQTQKWLLLKFTGSDAEIDIHCDGSPEFSEWRWMALEELPSAVVEFKRGVYYRVEKHFAPIINRVVEGRLI